MNSKESNMDDLVGALVNELMTHRGAQLVASEQEALAAYERMVQARLENNLMSNLTIYQACSELAKTNTDGVTLNAAASLIGKSSPKLRRIIEAKDWVALDAGQLVPSVKGAESGFVIKTTTRQEDSILQFKLTLLGVIELVMNIE
ncbi:MAG: hypothetical protein ACRCXB_21365 [Aeromonadaceae bacterium]